MDAAITPDLRLSALSMRLHRLQVELAATMADLNEILLAPAPAVQLSALDMGAEAGGPPPDVSSLNSSPAVNPETTAPSAIFSGLPKRHEPLFSPDRKALIVSAIKKGMKVKQLLGLLQELAGPALTYEQVSVRYYEVKAQLEAEPAAEEQTNLPPLPEVPEDPWTDERKSLAYKLYRRGERPAVIRDTLSALNGPPLTAKQVENKCTVWREADKRAGRPLPVPPAAPVPPAPVRPPVPAPAPEKAIAPRVQPAADGRDPWTPERSKAAHTALALGQSAFQAFGRISRMAGPPLTVDHISQKFGQLRGRP